MAPAPRELELELGRRTLDECKRCSKIKLLKPWGLHTRFIHEVCKDVRGGNRAPERAMRAQPHAQPLRRKDETRARKLNIE